MTSTHYSTCDPDFFDKSYPTRKIYYSTEKREIAIKALMVPNGQLLDADKTFLWFSNAQPIQQRCN